ncbi:MAG: Holliday junction resolvase RuvX [Mollicutes bacterium]|jgi:putative Holliday junction resolvase|nr:Holliday junction resolvase RuvX [Mollicutes bacterium]
MRYLGLDLGTTTLGVSISDETQTIASPLTVITFKEKQYDTLLPKIKEIVNQYKIKGIVLGLPKNMNNTIGERANTTLLFQKKLEEYLNIEVILQDERLTTIEATNYMLEADISRQKRKKKVDSLAASIILQTYLDKMKG